MPLHPTLVDALETPTKYPARCEAYCTEKIRTVVDTQITITPDSAYKAVVFSFVDDAYFYISLGINGHPAYELPSVNDSGAHYKLCAKAYTPVSFVSVFNAEFITSVKIRCDKATDFMATFFTPRNEFTG